MEGKGSMPEFIVSLAANITGALTLAEQEHLETGWDQAAKYIDTLDQSLLSWAALLLGACLVAKGAESMKFLVVAALSVALGGRTWIVARREAHGASGAVSALLVVASAVVFVHRVYPLMVFFFGAMLGGIVTFACRASLGLDDSPTALLAFTMLVSVFSGLTFRHYRMMGWRFVTPVLGGLLSAASVRFWVASMFEAGPVSWLGFANDLSDPAATMLQPCEVFFAVFWGVCAILGWYCQLCKFFGGEDPLALPQFAARRLKQLQCIFPFVFDVADDSSGKPGHRMFRNASEPFLSQEVSNEDDPQRAKDYRPEAVVVLAVSSVLILNVFLIGKPLLFLGHVVLMSSAFLPFMTAGLMAYASPNRLLPGLSGPSKNGPLLRHFTHATFNILVLFCAIGGYLCMYWSHALTHESQIGLSAGTTWNRTLHAWIGYVILGMLFLMTFSGMAKMFAGLTGSSRSVATHHNILGRVMYGLAAVNQILGYFFRDLLPLWGSLLLTGMLLCAVLTTVHFLRARSEETIQRLSAFHPTTPSDDHWRRDAVQYAPDLEKNITLGEREISSATTRIESLRSMTTGGSTQGPGLPAVQESLFIRQRSYDWEAVLDAFEVHDRRVMLSAHFAEWHRHIQAAQISRANAALQGSNNLVDFLSAAMVGETRRAEEP